LYYSPLTRQAKESDKAAAVKNEKKKLQNDRQGTFLFMTAAY